MSKDNIIEIAQEETEEIGAYVHVFKKPFVYQGKTYERLTFDFGSLTGRDSLAIENELQALGKMVLTPEFSGEFLIRMAARACTEKIGSDAMEQMPMRDYNRIRSRARTFLLRLES